MKILQEAVIDVLDNIKKCIVNDSLAGIVLIDFRKAFTQSHIFSNLSNFLILVTT